MSIIIFPKLNHNENENLISTIENPFGFKNQLENPNENPFGFKTIENNAKNHDEKIPYRTPIEYENDKNIFLKAEKGNNCIFLNYDSYNKLSEQTKRKISHDVKYCGNYVSISNNSIY